MITRSKALKIKSLPTGDGALVPAGTRINWNGQLKRAAVVLRDTMENNPDNTPTLWEDIIYENGYRVIPDVITAGTAFSKGERRMEGGFVRIPQ